jgi:hypothetical protein
VFRRNGFLGVGAAIVLAVALTLSVGGALSLLEGRGLEPVDRVAVFVIRNPGGPPTLFIVSLLLAIAAVRKWSPLD